MLVAKRAGGMMQDGPRERSSGAPLRDADWYYFATVSIERSAIPFRTSSAELARAAFSSAENGTSTIFSIPSAPRMHGTPR